mgnify:CR=1 FL=1
MKSRFKHAPIFQSFLLSVGVITTFVAFNQFTYVYTVTADIWDFLRVFNVFCAVAAHCGSGKSARFRPDISCLFMYCLLQTTE